MERDNLVIPSDDSIIKKSLYETTDLIRIKINDIETRQSELKLLIDDLKIDVDQMRQDIYNMSIAQVPNYQAIGTMRRAVNESLQIVNNFYSTDKEYEGVKMRYIKQKDDISLSSYKMIMIDLKKLDNVSEDYKDIMIDITKLINNTVDKIKNTNIETEKTDTIKEKVKAKKELNDLLHFEGNQYDL